MHHSLQSYNFKESFVRFLADEWKKDNYNVITRGKVVFFTQGQRCIRKEEMMNEEIEEFECMQEEADTRKLFHCNKVAEKSRKSLSFCIKSNDTDVIIIFLGSVDTQHQYFVEYGCGEKRR